ncbi:MAG: pyridoxal phosphate-dependent aminotransferase [Anaerolineae bacterium]|nr:pyridoxal phosphate-dependent aminotransferase [Anaerolineae bacterium]
MVVEPRYAVPDQHLIPLVDYPTGMMPIPPSKMFIIKLALDQYKEKAGADATVFDASQGDGGASLSGVPPEIIMQAAEMQVKHGSGYDKPYGYDGFRKAVVEAYWNIKPETGWGVPNVVAGIGGRDVLMKAFDAMIHCGRGYVGDVLLTSTVPWISYNWGPYAAGLNVLRAPGDENDGWALNEDNLTEAVRFAQAQGRHIAGMLITSPDNPTGLTLPLERQIALARKALELGVGFVLFDWIYHWITEGQPHDINQVLLAFSPEERNRLMFLDGLTKSMGASNVRSAHLIASEEVTKFIVSRASHGVFPNYFSQAVAVVAYEMGFGKAAASTIQPTNASRKVLRKLLEDHGYRHIMGDGYYAFVDVSRYCHDGFDSIEIGTRLAENHGVAVVPGTHFSEAGSKWFRFSYATPPERTEGAFWRMHEGLNALA